MTLPDSVRAPRDLRGLGLDLWLAGLAIALHRVFDSPRDPLIAGTLRRPGGRCDPRHLAQVRTTATRLG